MVQKKQLDETQNDPIPPDLEAQSEIPPSVAATGSTNEIGGEEIVEAEVGGEGVADVVKPKDGEPRGPEAEREAA